MQVIDLIILQLCGCGSLSIWTFPFYYPITCIYMIWVSLLFDPALRWSYSMCCYTLREIFIPSIFFMAAPFYQMEICWMSCGSFLWNMYSCFFPKRGCRRLRKLLNETSICSKKNDSPPLVKTVDLPHYTLDEDFVLIHRYETRQELLLLQQIQFIQRGSRGYMFSIKWYFWGNTKVLNTTWPNTSLFQAQTDFH